MAERNAAAAGASPGLYALLLRLSQRLDAIEAKLRAIEKKIEEMKPK